MTIAEALPKPQTGRQQELTHTFGASSSGLDHHARACLNEADTDPHLRVTLT